MIKNISKALTIGASISLIWFTPAHAEGDHELMRSLATRGVQFAAKHTVGLDLDQDDVRQTGRSTKHFFSRLFKKDKKGSTSRASSPRTMRRCGSPASMDVMFDSVDGHERRARAHSDTLKESSAYVPGPKPRTTGTRVDAFGYHGLSYRGIRRLLADRAIHDGEGWISAVQNVGNAFYDVSRELKQSLQSNPYRHLTKFYLEGEVLQVSVPHPENAGPNKMYSLVVLETNTEEANILQGLKRWAEIGNSGYGVTDKINLGNKIAKIQGENLTKIAQNIDRKTISLRLVDDKSGRYAVSTYDTEGLARDFALITLHNKK